jgi:hypothetical protein
MLKVTPLPTVVKCTCIKLWMDLGNFERETLSDHIHYMPGLMLLATLFQRKASAIHNTYLSICLSVYGSVVLLLDLGCFFSFLILYAVGRTPSTGISPSQPTHKTTQTRNKSTHTDVHMPSVRFEPRSMRSSKRRLFMAYSARPLWSATSKYLVLKYENFDKFEFHIWKLKVGHLFQCQYVNYHGTTMWQWLFYEVMTSSY